ncbi:MAG: hypothetical protein KBE65_02805 [Phycisphaerae bacterium]|nr:hypothetical protein [Phycisphaerae bacterium]
MEIPATLPLADGNALPGKAVDGNVKATNLSVHGEKEITMPLIELDASCEVADAGKRQQLAGALSRVVAEGTGKPEQYVMACVRDKVAMAMSGQAGPSALVTVKAIGGLTKTVNQSLAGKICQMLQKELAIPADRVYITFQELAASNWAWNGKTFG